MTRSTTTHATRVLLLLAAALTLALGMSLASPAVAFVDDNGDDNGDDTADAQVDEAPEEPDGDQAGEASDNGFVDEASDDREAAPTGGVDAGFGGGAGDEGSLGAAHAAAVTLLGLAIAAHTATARRTSRVHA